MFTFGSHPELKHAILRGNQKAPGHVQHNHVWIWNATASTWELHTYDTAINVPASTNTIIARVFVVKGLQHLAVEIAALSDDPEPIRGLKRPSPRTAAAPARARRASHASSSGQREGVSPLASSSQGGCAPNKSGTLSGARSMSTFSEMMRREGIDWSSESDDDDLPSGPELVAQMGKGKKRARDRSASLEVVDGTPYGQNAKRGRREPRAKVGTSIAEGQGMKGKQKASWGTPQSEVIDVDAYLAELEE